ncbi:MAG: TetR/AcrR family transcriptional regulator [Planctomycetota bacterium]
MVVLRDNKMNGISDKGVQGRLLDAAEELFCERGFEGTSIRDIAASAGCNIAAVNYYFGSKGKLYLEVWRRHLGAMRETRIASIEKVMSQKDAEPSLEDLLTSYADAFVEPLLDKHTGGRFVRLMAREMVDKHLPQNVFVEEMVVPVMTALQQALMRICPGLDELRAKLAILSIVGQLVHTICAKTMFEQSSNPAVPRFDQDEVVKHIVKFSAAGIRAYAEGKA